MHFDSSFPLQWRRRPQLAIAYRTIQPLAAFADATLIIVSAIVGGSGYQLYLEHSLGDVGIYSGFGLVGATIYAISARHQGLYRLSNLLKPGQDYLLVVASWLFMVLVGILLVFLLKIGNQISRGSILTYFFVALASLVILRKFLKHILRKSLNSGAIRGRRALLVGTSAELNQFRPTELLNTYGIEEVERVLLASGDERWSKLDVALKKATSLAKAACVEEIVLALPWQNAKLLEVARQQFRVTPLRVRLLPDTSTRSILDFEAGNSKSSLLLDVQREPLSDVELRLKRAFDLGFGCLLLVVFSPLLLLTAGAIKATSGGPVIFRQRRIGFNGRPFGILKFRTMTVYENGSHIEQARENDPRVTKLGRALRRTSIDELPQLLNVIYGDMSLVGPRPHAIAHDDHYGQQIAEYAYRSHVKPGMTGWAQVNGLRGRTQTVQVMEKRIKYDLWYISHWSIWLDLAILCRTAIEMLKARNAI